MYYEETRQVYSINELSCHKHKINIPIFQEFLYAKIGLYLDGKVTWFEMTHSCVNNTPQLLKCCIILVTKNSYLLAQAMSKFIFACTNEWKQNSIAVCMHLQRQQSSMQNEHGLNKSTTSKLLSSIVPYKVTHKSQLQNSQNALACQVGLFTAALH